MGIVDKLFGREEATQQQQTGRQVESQPLAGPTSDEQALARYRYMLQTAPPETIEHRTPKHSRGLRRNSAALCLKG